MMEMERKMAKRFNSPWLAPWVNEGINRVLSAATDVQEMNGASPFEVDMNGQPVVGLRPGYGRGGAPASVQIGVALGALAKNWMAVPASKAAVEASRPPHVPKDEYSERDKYFHCRGNCEAAQVGPIGDFTAAIASDYGKEFVDEFTTETGAEEADRVANRQGRSVGRSEGQCYEGCKNRMKPWVVMPNEYR